MSVLTIFQPMKPAYPIDAFHLAVREAAYEVFEHTQAPDALVGISFMHCLTVACQGLIDVRLPTGQLTAVSQNMLIIAESGERKTTVSNCVLKPFYDADNKALAMYRSRLKEFEIDEALWNATFKGVTRAISKAASKGESTTTLKQQLSEHGKLKPKKPRLRLFFYQDITDRSIMEALHGDGESIALSIDEGHVYFKSAASSSFGLLNRIWDSPETLSLNRADLELLFAKHPRGSSFIMTQPEPFKVYVERRGAGARGSGHWARYLVAWPQSTQGYRGVRPSEQVWQHLPKFHSRVSELLERYRTMIESGKVERETIEFSEEAKVRWYDISAQTEGMLRPGEYLNDINDFASKIMEITARLAAAMHFFNNEDGKITYDTLERAFALVRWHIKEFKYLFSPQYAIPQQQVDAREISSWLRTRIWGGVTSDTVVPKNFVLNSGPVRLSRRLDAALDILVAQGGIQVVQDYLPKSKKKYVRLMNHFFANVIA